ERGIFNLEGARKHVERSGRRIAHLVRGINPCVSADTLIWIKQGQFPIGDLLGKEVLVWNGEQYSKVVPFSTGVNPTLIITFSDGSRIRCTPYHTFIVKNKGRFAANMLRVGSE